MARSPYGKRPITTIRHGIDTDYFSPPAQEGLDELRTRIFGPGWQGKLLLGSAGGTDYDKGWLDLVAAAAALPPADKARVLLMVAGDAPSEAKLAREAEITYATIAMVTDYDCWHPGHDAVDVKLSRPVEACRFSGDEARPQVFCR